MKHALPGVALVVAISSVTQGAAQNRPTFSGVWTYDATQSDKTTAEVRVDSRAGSRALVQMDRAPAPDLGYEFSAQQDSTSLTLVVSPVKAMEGAPSVLLNGVPVDAKTAAVALRYSIVCRFDGSASHNAIPDGRFIGGGIDAAQKFEVVATAAWNHDALVIVTTPHAPDPSAVLPPSVRRSLRLSAGGALVVETIKVTAGVPIPSTAVYTRKPAVTHE